MLRPHTNIILGEFNKKKHLKDMGLFSLKNKWFGRDVVYICGYKRLSCGRGKICSGQSLRADVGPFVLQFGEQVLVQCQEICVCQ